MFKKVVSLVALLALVLTACACAAGSPVSWPTAPVTCVSSIPGVTTTASPLTPAAAALKDSLAGKTAAEFVGDEFKLNAIAGGIVPADVDFSKYSVAAMFSLSIAGYQAGMGDMTVVFPVEPKLNATDNVLGAAGIINGADVAWNPVAAKVNADGACEATFTEDLINTIQNGTGESVFAILVG